MNKLLIILSLCFVFAGELEVDGDLKVTGNIDAQNNPIKNVGIPQELTDAINGNVLQDALRDDGNYEYKILSVYLTWNSNYNGWIGTSLWVDISEINNESPSTDEAYYNHINTLSSSVASFVNDGWILDSINGADDSSFWIFKRPIEE